MIESEELKKRLETNLVGVIRELIDEVADHATALEYFAEADKGRNIYMTTPVMTTLKESTDTYERTNELDDQVEFFNSVNPFNIHAKIKDNAVGIVPPVSCGPAQVKRGEPGRLVYLEDRFERIRDWLNLENKSKDKERLEYLEAKVKELKDYALTGSGSLNFGNDLYTRAERIMELIESL